VHAAITVYESTGSRSTQRKHAGFSVEFKPLAPCFFAIGFYFEVETVEVIETIEFFLWPGSAALRISEHSWLLSISYTVIVLT
jgi:hypothetical protein